jgi:hypothetical protein
MAITAHSASGDGFVPLGAVAVSAGASFFF